MVHIVDRITLDDATTGTQTGTVAEPSFATSGLRTIVVGNFFTTRTRDGGATWRFADPLTTFPPAGDGICTDQLMIYVRRRRLWVWLLQYGPLAGTNVFRLAASRTGASGTWTTWDFAPTDMDPALGGLWFDYPHLGTTEEHLWVSFNLFTTHNAWARAAVMRFPLDDLTAKGPLRRTVWTTAETGSLRFVEGAGDEMIFAGHRHDNTALVLHAWPDADTTVSSWTLPVRPWNDRGYNSALPDGSTWLGRIDGRITGAWRARGMLGFAWTAADEPGRDHPYVRIARFDEDTLDLVDEPDLSSVRGAYAYPAVAANRRGDVGLAAFFGGPHHPSHVVGTLEESGGAPLWSIAEVARSTHAPTQGRWGDHLTCRPHPTRRTSWLATGFTLQGGSDRRHVEPTLTQFRP